MAEPAVQPVEFLKAPSGALQPQALLDSKGIIHLIYLYGDPAASDIGYVRKGPADNQFTSPIRVNDRSGSAVALGTVRGAHLSLGSADQIHVAWNGSTTATPKGPRNSAPMLYTRLNENRTGFQPQRSLMTVASGLDGGGTLTSDRKGNVFVAWHAQGHQNGQPVEGEGHRRVWLARSTDNGDSFDSEQPVSPADLGACGCCGMGALSDESGNLYLLYRTARQTIHRDMYLLVSRDRGRTFQSMNIHPWEIGACPMSTVSLTAANGRVFLAWETAKQVYFTAVDSRSMTVGKPIAAPGAGTNRKHPTIAVDRDGRVLLAWTEGTGWKKGGSIAWQMFDPSGQSLGIEGESAGLPAWDFVSALCVKNRFLIVS